MKFEKISNVKENYLTVNDLSHGIDENENTPARLIDAVNVCLKGKKAVSRKGMKICGEAFYKPESMNFANAGSNATTIFSDGEYKKLIVLKETDDATYVQYCFKLLGDSSDETDMGNIRFTPVTSQYFNEPLSVFVFAGKKTVGQGIYAVFGFMSDAVSGSGFFMKIYEYEGGENWQELSDDDMYAPIIYKNGRGANYELSEKKFDAPEFVEKPNMFCNKTRYFYNADGSSGTFIIPTDEIKEEDTAYIKCIVEVANNQKIEFVISGDRITSDPVSYMGVNATMTVDRPTKKLQFDNFVPPFLYGKTNTVEFIISQSNEENTKKISNMQFGIWYNAGNSGSRLFAAGNNFYPSLLMASAPDNPLYFPDDNQFLVGDPTQKITILARQNKSLVVFKQKEIYCGAYSSGKFSITHLHSEIGCDLPSTVVLCGNRVVWATTDKCIYTLNALSDYGAVAVYRISSKIENALAQMDFSSACAAYKDDVYYLFLKDRVCVMNVSGALLQSNKQFLESASFTFWELPKSISVQLALSVRDGLRTVCSTENDSGQILFICSFSGVGNEDEIMYRTQDEFSVEKSPFCSMLTFGNCPNFTSAKHSFYKLYLSCFAENGIDVEYTDETGDIRKNCRIDMKYTKLKLPVPYRLMPLISGSNMVMRIAALGEFSFSGYTLYYRDFI